MPTQNEIRKLVLKAISKNYNVPLDTVEDSFPLEEPTESAMAVGAVMDLEDLLDLCVTDPQIAEIENGTAGDMVTLIVRLVAAKQPGDAVPA